MSKEAQLPSEKDLKKLSLRAVVAYAARAAMRVRPLFESKVPEDGKLIDEAIAIAVAVAANTANEANLAGNMAGKSAQTAYANGVNAAAAKAGHVAGYACMSAAPVAYAANQVVSAKEVFSDVIATAFNASDLAVKIGGEMVAMGCRQDYEALVQLSQGAKKQLGEPIDFSQFPPA